MEAIPEASVKLAETEMGLLGAITDNVLLAVTTGGVVSNVKPASVAVPPGVVTLTLPEVPDATTAVMLVAETTLKDVAAVPPKLTAVVPIKLVPVMVMVVPLPALVGVKLVIVGYPTVLRNTETVLLK